MAANSRLFKPLQVGPYTLSNRVVLAPLTRFRASDSHAPLPFVADYYAQRGSVAGTLLISEATFISAKAAGYPNVPTLATDEALQAWRAVTDAVHAKGSFIFCQLWALGRVAYPTVLEAEKAAGADNLGLVGSSAIAHEEGAAVPRELTEAEIESFIADYAAAARAAVEVAGFDGVEIHGANGYLVDQFTQDVSNQRTDRWGGSIENRSRFGLEVTRAVVAAIGADRVGIRLSPYNNFQGMGMKEPKPQFDHLIRGLRPLGLAYLHLVEARMKGADVVDTPDNLDFALEAWGAGPTGGNSAPVLLAGGYNEDNAVAAVEDAHKDQNVGIVYGRYFISNPDLVFRLQHGIRFAPYDRTTFYAAKSREGYVDYSFSEEWQKENSSQGHL
ncbi:NADH:flavin oxidoreductase NADH oxidase family protein [Grosmannia clavigera kw1407]|uniref:NADH:flavin oxidoreductase NADH oxidase family protein n=1 Tax=Grosmannia clavigera (strain kw1407 / UAMH 11150) TaxID=655863 RepID=F0XHY2_GROCL|nr:NADH:flavin oxidoreductase NADH oxidase family protein [Grosmannia clavigera kw1407]EFX02683.1 NADH:flavin oxidoreductase NADH oxidase family protein [Grosmannia clavigera kw1407]